MEFTYTVQYDDDYVPWGDHGIEEKETEEINNGKWAAYSVIVRATGPIDAEESMSGIVVPLTGTGVFHDANALQDTSVREIAEDLARGIEAGYQALLVAKRAEIDAALAKIT